MAAESDPVAAGQAAWAAQKAALLDYVNEPAHLRTLVGVFREVSSLQAAERRAEVARQEAAALHQRQQERAQARITELEADNAALRASERRTRALLEAAVNRLATAGLPIEDLAAPDA